MELKNVIWQHRILLCRLYEYEYSLMQIGNGAFSLDDIQNVLRSEISAVFRIHRVQIVEFWRAVSKSKWLDGERGRKYNIKIKEILLPTEILSRMLVFICVRTQNV